MIVTLVLAISEPLKAGKIGYKLGISIPTYEKYSGIKKIIYIFTLVYFIDIFCRGGKKYYLFYGLICETVSANFYTNNC